MPELKKPTSEVVGQLGKVKEKASQDWVIGLDKHYQKQDACRVNPNCELIK